MRNPNNPNNRRIKFLRALEELTPIQQLILNPECEIRYPGTNETMCSEGSFIPIGVSNGEDCEILNLTDYCESADLGDIPKDSSERSNDQWIELIRCRLIRLAQVLATMAIME